MGPSWRAALGRRLKELAYDAFRRSPWVARRLATRLLTPNYTVGAVAVCRDRDGRVLLVRSRQHAGWGLPGGLLRRGETPVEGFARELAEELGADVAPGSLAARPTATVVDPAVQQVTVVVSVDLGDRPEADGSEVLETRWFGPREIPHRLVRGTAESLAALTAGPEQAGR